MPRTILLLALLLGALPVTATAQASAPSRHSILIQVTSGPEDPTRAAAAFLIAKAAVEEGHSVSIFLLGDAVQLIRDQVINSLTGLGPGPLRASFDAVVKGGGRIYLSGPSSTARGVTAADLAGKPAQFSTPNELVRLSLTHDRIFTY